MSRNVRASDAGELDAGSCLTGAWRYLRALCALSGLALFMASAVDASRTGGLTLHESQPDAVALAGGHGIGSWESAVFTLPGQSGSLPFQLFTPEVVLSPDTQPQERSVPSLDYVPLVVFLHGSGEAGTDNEQHMYFDRNVGPAFFGSPAVQQHYPAFVLAPQTPRKIRWASTSLHEYDFATTPMTVSMKLLFALIDKQLAVLPVDRQRVYIGGLSRGGHGTWNALLHRPGFFAAGFPMAGGGSPAYAARISHLAIWAFHGDADEITPLRYTQRMYGAVWALSPHSERLRLSVYAGGIHRSAWLRGHREPDFPGWIFQWRNPNVDAPPQQAFDDMAVHND